MLKYFSEVEFIVWYQRYSLSLKWEKREGTCHIILPVIKEMWNCGHTNQTNHNSEATGLEILAVDKLRVATTNECISRNTR